MLKLHSTVIVAGCLLSASVAGASQTRFQQRGTTAYVLAGQQLDQCKSWSLSANLAEKSVKDEPGAPEKTNTALVSFQVFDDCARSYTFFQLDLSNAAVFQGNVNSASLQLNTPVTATTCSYDEPFECNDATLPLTASLTWTASGNPEHDKQNVVSQNPAGSTHFRFTGTSRDSSVSGTLTLNGSSYALTADTVLATTFGGSSVSFLKLNRR